MSQKTNETDSNPIVNTTKIANENPGSILAEGMLSHMLGEPLDAPILRMEAAGQQQLTEQTSRLPTLGLTKPMFGDDSSLAEIWKGMGVKIGPVVADDPIFTEVTLPAGWKIVPTEHSMWSNLVDEKARQRAAIFYKAAYYERRCHIMPQTRFQIQYVQYVEVPNEGYDSSQRQVLDASAGSVVFTSAIHRKAGIHSAPHSERATKECEKWLKENYPDHRNPLAYW